MFGPGIDEEVEIEQQKAVHVVQRLMDLGGSTIHSSSLHRLSVQSLAHGQSDAGAEGRLVTVPGEVVCTASDRRMGSIEGSQSSTHFASCGDMVGRSSSQRDLSKGGRDASSGPSDEALPVV